MLKIIIIRARTEPKLKRQAEMVLEEMGITPTQIITMLYKKIVRERNIPFNVKIPNKETLQAMKDAKRGHNLKEFDMVDKMFESLDE